MQTSSHEDLVSMQVMVVADTLAMVVSILNQANPLISSQLNGLIDGMHTQLKQSSQFAQEQLLGGHGPVATTLRRVWQAEGDPARIADQLPVLQIWADRPPELLSRLFRPRLDFGHGREHRYYGATTLNLDTNRRLPMFSNSVLDTMESGLYRGSLERGYGREDSGRILVLKTAQINHNVMIIDLSDLRVQVWTKVDLEKTWARSDRMEYAVQTDFVEQVHAFFASVGYTIPPDLSEGDLWASLDKRLSSYTTDQERLRPVNDTTTPVGEVFWARGYASVDDPTPAPLNAIEVYWGENDSLKLTPGHTFFVKDTLRRRRRNDSSYYAHNHDDISIIAWKNIGEYARYEVMAKALATIDTYFNPPAEIAETDSKDTHE